jgi:catechol 2,3-dioxygenase-like lactoylglutathione lyase family enzyme
MAALPLRGDTSTPIHAPRGVLGKTGDATLCFWLIEEARVILSLELVTVPVADVDRAKAFYVDQLGFQADMDVRTDGHRRFVRLTPPGSVCCIAIGEGWIESQPGSMQGTQLVVEDIDEIHAFLRARGVEVSDVQAFPWGRLCFFSDPDGNGWSVQEPPSPT